MGGNEPQKVKTPFLLHFRDRPIRTSLVSEYKSKSGDAYIIQCSNGDVKVGQILTPFFLLKKIIFQLTRNSKIYKLP